MLMSFSSLHSFSVNQNTKKSNLPFVDENDANRDVKLTGTVLNVSDFKINRNSCLLSVKSNNPEILEITALNHWKHSLQYFVTLSVVKINLIKNVTSLLLGVLYLRVDKCVLGLKDKREVSNTAPSSGFIINILKWFPLNWLCWSFACYCHFEECDGLEISRLVCLIMACLT